MSDGPLFRSTNSALRRPSFLVHSTTDCNGIDGPFQPQLGSELVSITMRLRSLSSAPCNAIADYLTQSPQPVARPGKLDTQNCEAGRNHDECWTGRNDHHYAKCKHRNADNRYHDTARSLDRQLQSFCDHFSLRLRGSTLTQFAHIDRNSGSCTVSCDVCFSQGLEIRPS